MLKVIDSPVGAMRGHRVARLAALPIYDIIVAELLL